MSLPFFMSVYLAPPGGVRGTRKEWKRKMVHTFTALGQYLAADVNSGAVHVLDKLSYDLLSAAEGPLGEKLPEELAKKLCQYDRGELEELQALLEELKGGPRA